MRGGSGGRLLLVNTPDARSEVVSHPDELVRQCGLVRGLHLRDGRGGPISLSQPELGPAEVVRAGPLGLEAACHLELGWGSCAQLMGAALLDDRCREKEIQQLERPLLFRDVVELEGA